MVRCRVYYQPSGKVSVDHPDQRSEKKPANMTNDEWINAQLAQSLAKKPGLHVDDNLAKPPLPFDDTDTDQLPVRDENRNRWRGSKGQGVAIDNTVVLRQDIEKDLDAELAKTNPSALKAVRLQRKLDKGEYD